MLRSLERMYRSSFLYIIFVAPSTSELRIISQKKRENRDRISELRERARNFRERVGERNSKIFNNGVSRTADSAAETRRVARF